MPEKVFPGCVGACTWDRAATPGAAAGHRLTFGIRAATWTAHEGSTGGMAWRGEKGGLRDGPSESRDTGADQGHVEQWGPRQETPPIGP
jgi:hypothetical protein